MTLPTGRPWTVLAITRAPDVATQPSDGAVFTAGRKTPTSDFVQPTLTNDTSPNALLAAGEQEAQGDAAGKWDPTQATNLPHDDTRYYYSVMTSAGDTNVRYYAAAEDATVFTDLGEMSASPSFTSPIVDFPLERIYLGCGWNSATDAINKRFQRGRIIALQVWGNKALTKAELEEILNSENKFFRHLVAPESQFVQLPFAPATAKSDAPQIITTDTTRSPILRIPTQLRNVLQIDVSKTLRPTHTYYFEGGLTSLPVPAFEDAGYTIEPAVAPDILGPKWDLTGPEGPEIFFDLDANRSAYVTPADIPGYPWTILAITRFPNVASITSDCAVFTAGRANPTADFVRDSITNDTAPFGLIAEGSQQAQGNIDTKWDSSLNTFLPHDDSRFYYSVMTAASGTDIRCYAAPDNAVAFTDLGEMSASPNFTAPIVDFPLERIHLGCGWNPTTDAINKRFQRGRIISLQVWSGTALTEANLNELLNDPDKFFRHIRRVPDTATDIDLPAAAATTQASAPSVEVETNTTINLPATASTAKADAPRVVAPGAAVQVNLPAAPATARARTPTVSGKVTTTVRLAARGALGRALSPLVGVETAAIINLPAAAVSAARAAPQVTIPERAVDITLPAASATTSSRNPRITAGAGADIDLSAAPATARSLAGLTITTDKLAKPFPYQFFQPDDRSRYGIQVPTENVQSLQRSAMQAKEAVEALLGYRGSLYEGLNFGGSSDQSEPQDFSQLLEYLQTVEERLVDHDSRITTNDERITTNEGDIDQLQIDLVNLEGRVFDLEQITKALADGVYAHGVTTNLAWSPGVSSPTAATRIPIQTVNFASNVTVDPDGFSLVPSFDADYWIDFRLNLDLSSAQNNRVWILAIFEDGVEQGRTEFNTRDVAGDLRLSARLGDSMQAGDIIDLRLWSTNAGSSLVIANFTASLFLAGLDESAVTP